MGNQLQCISSVFCKIFLLFALDLFLQKMTLKPLVYCQTRQQLLCLFHLRQQTTLLKTLFFSYSFSDLSGTEFSSACQDDLYWLFLTTIWRHRTKRLCFIFVRPYLCANIFDVWRHQSACFELRLPFSLHKTPKSLIVWCIDTRTLLINAGDILFFIQHTV